MNIGIVGLGVMGASFAKRLTQLDHTVFGFDIDQDTLNIATSQNIIQKGYTQASEGIDQCELVIICLYPTVIKAWIQENQDAFKPGTLILEISGVKSNVLVPIQDIMRSDCELLSVHPMCGRESRGIHHADETIFNNANFILIPTEKNDPHSIDIVKALAASLGCTNISCLSIEEHDRMIGFLSQLTHVIAVSLMNTHENSHLVEFTGDSFRDLTRIASINEDLWSELFLLNKDILLDEIDQFLASMIHFKNALINDDKETMKALMIESTKRRECFNKK